MSAKKMTRNVIMKWIKMKNNFNLFEKKRSVFIFSSNQMATIGSEDRGSFQGQILFIEFRALLADEQSAFGTSSYRYPCEICRKIQCFALISKLWLVRMI